MITPLHQRLVLTLRTTGGLHPGSGDSDGTTDADVTRDGAGRLVLRASSAIGMLRHALCRPGLFSERELTTLLGGTDNDDGPSLISVDDAVIADARLEPRHGVGLDRITGTAADEIKYDTTVIARGATFWLALDGDCTPRDLPLQREFFAAVHRIASSGDARFGGRVTRGLGGTELLTHTYGEVDDNADIITSSRALRNRSFNASPLPTTTRLPSAPIIRFEIDWAPRLAAFSKAALAASIAVPETALIRTPTESSEYSLALLLAGSSIKGAFRSHAEYMVRTRRALHGTGVPINTDFSEQLRVPGVESLFGWSADADPDAAHVGAVAVNDCYGLSRISEDGWSALLDAITAFDPDASPGGGVWPTIRTTLDEMGLNAWRTDAHNSVNEFTGGVSDGRLFGTLLPCREQYEPIVITLDTARLGDQAAPLTGLLLSVLRNFAHGRVPLGFGESKGYGHVRPTSSVIRAHIIGMAAHDSAGFDPFSPEARKWLAPYTDALSAWIPDAAKDAA